MRTLRALSLLLFLLPAAALHAQEYGVAAHISSLLPMGGMADRFKPTAGGAVTFTVHRGSPEWSGSIEYFRFGTAADRSITRTVTDSASGVEQAVVFPLEELDMTLEAWGASATASWGLFTLGPVDTRLSLTLGFYRWTFVRGAYTDSLYADIGGTTVLADVLNVPESRQEEWSGGFAVGLDVVVPLFEPVYLSAGARYRALIGELWPTLALELESVSTMQMVDLRAGLEVRW
jgi:hypothetical protein